MAESFVFNLEEVKKAAKFAWYVATVTALKSQNDAKTIFTEINFGASIPPANKNEFNTILNKKDVFLKLIMIETKKLQSHQKLSAIL